MFINSNLRTDSGISANSEGVVRRRPRLSAGTGPAPRTQGECPQCGRRRRAVAGTRQYKTGRLIKKLIYSTVGLKFSQAEPDRLYIKIPKYI